MLCIAVDVDVRIYSFCAMLGFMPETQNLPASRILEDVFLFRIEVHGKQVVCIRILSEDSRHTVSGRSVQAAGIMLHLCYSTTSPSEKFCRSSVSMVRDFPIGWCPEPAFAGPFSNGLLVVVGLQGFI